MVLPGGGIRSTPLQAELQPSAARAIWEQVSANKQTPAVPAGGPRRNPPGQQARWLLAARIVWQNTRRLHAADRAHLRGGRARPAPDIFARTKRPVRQRRSRATRRASERARTQPSCNAREGC